MAKKTCFVIQGFGKKTDYQTGRTFDLGASYEVIKEAVIDAGLECVRADEIRHSGTIDQPPYEQILAADLVIADLSTYNLTQSTSSVSAMRCAGAQPSSSPKPASSLRSTSATSRSGITSIPVRKEAHDAGSGTREAPGRNRFRYRHGQQY